MDARTCSRWGLCLLVAVLATGCGPLRGFRHLDPAVPTDPGKSNVIPNDNPSSGQSSPDAIPGGTVIAAGGPAPSGRPVGVQDPPVNGNGNPPPPAPLPQARPWPQANGQPPLMMPPAAPPGYYPPQTPFADPHLRANPTVTGGRLQLAPWEVPADRVIELTKQAELLIAQNTALLARIKELETLGVGREESLKEAAREIETITTAAAKERAALAAQIDTLQGKIKQLEEEDIRLLEAVIEALKKLLPPERP